MIPSNIETQPLLQLADCSCTSLNPNVLALWDRDWLLAYKNGQKMLTPRSKKIGQMCLVFVLERQVGTMNKVQYLSFWYQKKTALSSKLFPNYVIDIFLSVISLSLII